MADLQFNIAKGKTGYYMSQVGVGNAALIAVLVKATGLEADSTLKDYDTLALLLAGTTDECDFTNYARKTITSVTNTVDDTNDRLDVDVADQTWAAAGGGTNNTIGAVIWCFDPDTTGGTDTTLVPLLKNDYTETTTGSSIQIQIDAAGLFRSV